MPVLGFVVGPSTSSESSFSAVAVYSSAVLRGEKSSSKRSGTICDRTLRAIKDAIAGKACKLTFSMLWLQWTPKVVLNAEFYTKSDALEAELTVENSLEQFVIRH